MSPDPSPQRGEVWWVAFDPSVGGEIQKTRPAVIVSNDGPYDNWQGEFAMTMASSGQMQLAGIVVNASMNYPSIDSNMQGWRAMAMASSLVTAMTSSM